MNKWIYFIMFSVLVADSTTTIHKKFDWKLNLIPCVGQIKNEKYVKAGILASLQSYSIYKLSDYSKKEQIGKRNTYAWWSLGLYFYGIIDSYVDYHLRQFPSTKKQKKEEKQ